MKIYYTVYKITNKINGRIYIGCHKTVDLNDGYMGSGKILKRAIEKYGIDNFEKSILAAFDTPEEMFCLEAILVDKKFVESNETYNICEGGKGGFGFINNNGLNLYGKNRENMLLIQPMGSRAAQEKIKENPDAHKENISRGLATYYENGGIGSFTGKRHSIETKKKMRKLSKGKMKDKLNSQYNTMWIYNDVQMKNRKICKNSNVPHGWKIGRIVNWEKYFEQK